MPKLLIIEACLVNYNDDRGGVHQSVGDLPEVSKETALTLVRAGRALYAVKADDPDKSGRNTASPDMLRAAAALGKTGGRDKAPPQPDPAN